VVELSYITPWLGSNLLPRIYLSEDPTGPTAWMIIREKNNHKQRKKICNTYRTGTTLVKALGDKYEFCELILKCRLRWTSLDIVTIGEFRGYPFTLLLRVTWRMVQITLWLNSCVSGNVSRNRMIPWEARFTNLSKFTFCVDRWARTEHCAVFAYVA